MQRTSSTLSALFAAMKTPTFTHAEISGAHNGGLRHKAFDGAATDVPQVGCIEADMIDEAAATTRALG